MKFANISKGLLLGLALLLATSVFAVPTGVRCKLLDPVTVERDSIARRRILGEVGRHRSQRSVEHSEG